MVTGRRPPPGLRFRWASPHHQRDFILGLGPYQTKRDLFGDRTAPAVVGYPLTVRGREFTHVGVLWGADLVWRGTRWLPQTDYVPKGNTDIPALRKAAELEARAGELGSATDDLVRALAGGYRILLTRAMRSVRVWVEDEETREYVKQQWKAFLAE